MKKRPQPQTPPAAGTTITNCNFIGVKWDKPALGTLHVVAEALAGMVRLFNSQGLQVPLINIQGPAARVNASKGDE